MSVDKCAGCGTPLFKIRRNQRFCSRRLGRNCQQRVLTANRARLRRERREEREYQRRKAKRAELDARLAAASALPPEEVDRLARAAYDAVCPSPIADTLWREQGRPDPAKPPSPTPRRRHGARAGDPDYHEQVRLGDPRPRRRG